GVLDAVDVQVENVGFRYGGASADEQHTTDHGQCAFHFTSFERFRSLSLSRSSWSLSFASIWSARGEYFRAATSSLASEIASASGFAAISFSCCSMSFAVWALKSSIF